jgi:hypothetical protein
MYEEHPIFVHPDNEDIRIWRYMDFTKFVSLIDTRSLFFSRADKLGDPFEGSWPRMNVHARKQIPDEVPMEARDNFARTMEDMGIINKNWPRYNAVNCWHMNEHESAAMWKLYLKSDEGIAIQSTYRKLKRSLIDEEKIHVGVVKYIDFENEWIDAGNILSPFVHKRKSYEHEREVRALVTKFPIGDKGLDFSKDMIEAGLEIRIDVETLVERIYVAPSAPDWIVELVEAVVRRYGYNFNVVQSRLNEKPLF